MHPAPRLISTTRPSALARTPDNRGRGRITCYSYNWGDGEGRGVHANYCDPATMTRTVCDEGVSAFWVGGSRWGASPCVPVPSCLVGWGAVSCPGRLHHRSRLRNCCIYPHVSTSPSPRAVQLVYLIYAGLSPVQLVPQDHEVQGGGPVRVHRLVRHRRHLRHHHHHRGQRRRAQLLRRGLLQRRERPSALAGRGIGCRARVVLPSDVLGSDDPGRPLHAGVRQHLWALVPWGHWGCVEVVVAALGRRLQGMRAWRPPQEGAGCSCGGWGSWALWVVQRARAGVGRREEPVGACGCCGVVADPCPLLLRLAPAACALISRAYCAMGWHLRVALWIVDPLGSTGFP